MHNYWSNKAKEGNWKKRSTDVALKVHLDNLLTISGQI